MRVFLNILPLMMICSMAWSSHWKPVEWNGVELLAQVPAPFGSVRLILKSNDEHLLEEMTLEIDGTKISVPQSAFKDIKYPYLNEVLVKHDAGFAPQTDQEGGFALVSGTRVLVVELPFGDIQEDTEGEAVYPVFQCRFNEKALEACAVAP